MLIAIFEQDKELARKVMTWLEAAGHRQVCCSKETELRTCLDREVFDLLILDCASMGDAAAPLVRRCAEHQQGKMPILLLADPQPPEGVLSALEAGADDYLHKPVDREALLARIEVLVARHPRKPGSVPVIAEYGPFLIHHREHRITRFGEPLDLSGKDFSLAAYLFAHEGELLTRQQLLADVWGVSSEVNTRTVDVHISRLRKALKLKGTGFEIQTVHQQGYRLQRG